MKIQDKIKYLKIYLRYKREFYKKFTLSYPPLQVSIGIISACAFRCKFCSYHCDDAKGKSNVYNIPFILKFEDFKKMIDMCYQGNVPKVHITGTGEPFLHPDIIKMMDYAISVYGYISLQTDFYSVVFEKYNYLDQIIKRKKYIKYITTDILSGDPAEHEDIKKGSSYSHLLNSMKYISKHSNILFGAHLIITKHNYQNLNQIIEDLSKRRINARLEIVNLHPSNFNEFTSLDSVYTSKDEDITNALIDAKLHGKKKGIKVSIPDPFDKKEGQCGSFWTRFQTWPVKGNDPKRYHENVIIGGCNAVVKGNLNSLGYIFDYDNIMDLWNNEHFVKIRENLIKGIYPDKECVNCQSYNK